MQPISRVIIPLLILGVGVFALVGSSKLKSDPEKRPPEEQINLVRTEPVETYDKDLSIEIDGTVVPFREIHMAAEIEGRVKTKTKMCRAGRFVTAGTLLLEIDPVDFELTVQRLSRELAQAKVRVRELEVEIENTQELTKLAEEDLRLHRREVARLRRLKADRVITDTELDRVLRAELESKNALQRLKNQDRSAKTSREAAMQSVGLSATVLEQAQIDLKRTKVFAPIDGVVVEEPVEVDKYVKKGDSLVVIDDTEAVEVRCNLRMNQLIWLWRQSEGSPAAVSPSTSTVTSYELPSARAHIRYELDGQLYEWDGVLSRYDGLGLDGQTRTVPCRVLVEEPSVIRVADASPLAALSAGPPALVRGMFVKVTIYVSPRSSLLCLPREAVQPGNVVWRVEAGKLESRQVRIARLLSDDTALLYADGATIRVGDRVVVSPLAVAIDGMPVRELESP